MEKCYIMRGVTFYTWNFNFAESLWHEDEALAGKVDRTQAMQDAQRIANHDGQSVDIVPVNGSAAVTVQPDPRFVTAYAITRCYGGPEEGGWWYNQYTTLAAIPLESVSEVEAHAFLAKAYAHVKGGNIYSVNGGTDLAVISEWEKGSQEQPRPHYE